MTSVLPPRYVLDTSLFIQAKRSYYAFDIVRSFWQHLVKSANEGIITSIDKVYDEIERGKDDLHVWVQQNLPLQFFRDTDNSPDVLKNYQQLIGWSSSNTQFTSNAKESIHNNLNINPSDFNCFANIEIIYCSCYFV